MNATCLLVLLSATLAGPAAHAAERSAASPKLLGSEQRGETVTKTWRMPSARTLETVTSRGGTVHVRGARWSVVNESLAGAQGGTTRTVRALHDRSTGRTDKIEFDVPRAARIVEHMRAASMGIREDRVTYVDASGRGAYVFVDPATGATRP